MIPNQVMDQIKEFYGSLIANKPAMELLGKYMEKNIKPWLVQEDAYEKQLCTNCQYMQMYFDLLTPGNEKSSWEMVIRATMRCTKLLERFVVSDFYVGTRETPLPGQFTFRMFCPQFELYEEEKQEAPADAQED